MTDYSAQRREARFIFSADVLAQDVATGVRREGKVDNISRGGCFVRTSDPFLVWTHLRIWVVFRQQQFEAECSVTHARSGHGMGILFEKISAENQELLEDWLKELSP